MSEKEFLLWLQREKLLDTVKSNYQAFTGVLQNSLKVNKEKVLIMGDFGFPDRRVSPLVLGCYILAAKELRADYELRVQDATIRGTKDNTEVLEGLRSLDDQNSIVAAMSMKLKDMANLGKTFRTFTKEHKHRFLSTPGLGQLDTTYFNHLVEAMTVDYQEMYERGQVLKHQIDDADEIFVHTDKGTELYMNVRGMPGINNSGLYEDTLGGNIPAGEVYCAPRTNHVEGTVVIDGSLRTIDNTYLLKKPIKLEFQNGLLTDIKGEKGYLLERSLKWAEEKSNRPHGVRRLAELGIGTNPKASIVGPTVINEKTLGTAHIAIGSNAWFGGSIYAPIHLDHVFKNPIFEIDGREIEF